MSPWVWSGDRAILRTFDDADLPTANGRARALADALRTRADVVDAIPGARSVLVSLRPGTQPASDLFDALSEDRAPVRTEGTVHEIIATYDGPDLLDVAEFHGTSPARVIDTHAAASYVVGFTGFAPGFPYLIGLPTELHTPRRATPRTRVPAGAIGIGGEYTGIYPRATPGGWNLIGRADVTLFDPDRDPPALLLPGDRVRFVPR